MALASTARRVLRLGCLLIGGMVVLVLGGPLQGSVSSDPGSAERILRELAARTVHDGRDNDLGLDEQRRRYFVGDRLHLHCGYLVDLAQSLLDEAGIPNRQGAVITRQKLNGTSNGHTMVEVLVGSRWQVYDLSHNRQPRDHLGRGVSVVEFVKQERARVSHNWRLLADDPLVADRASAYSVKGFYRRVLGVALIEFRPGEFAFRERDQRKRLERYSPSYHWVGARRWDELQAGVPRP